MATVLFRLAFLASLGAWGACTSRDRGLDELVTDGLTPERYKTFISSGDLNKGVDSLYSEATFTVDFYVTDEESFAETCFNLPSDIECKEEDGDTDSETDGGSDSGVNSDQKKKANKPECEDVLTVKVLGSLYMVPSGCNDIRAIELNKDEVFSGKIFVGKKRNTPVNFTADFDDAHERLVVEVQYVGTFTLHRVGDTNLDVVGSGETD